MAESDKVINAVMQATGESYEKVSTFTAVIEIPTCVDGDSPRPHTQYALLATKAR